MIVQIFQKLFFGTTVRVAGCLHKLILLVVIVERFIGKYTAILERNSDDASVADILYIKDRRKKTDDFDMIFNEILLIRESINKPLKRDLDEYYEDRYSIFREE